MLCQSPSQLRFVESPSFWCHLLNELWYEVIPAIMHHYEIHCVGKIETRDLPGDIEYIDFHCWQRLEKNSKLMALAKTHIDYRKWLRMVKLRSMEDNDDSRLTGVLVMNAAIKFKTAMCCPIASSTSYSVQFVEKNSMNATYLIGQGITLCNSLH